MEVLYHIRAYVLGIFPYIGLIYPWLCNIAMENGPFIDGLPIANGDFPWQTVEITRW